jgi:DNA-binding phage protein
MVATLTTRYNFDLLVKARENTGRNNSEIARDTGISRPKIIEVMKGESSNVDHIGTVAELLGVSMSELFAKAA